MRAGLGTLHLAPRDFWSMTPRELAAAVRGHYGITDSTAAPSRAVLSNLIAAFPDHKSTAAS